MTKKETSCGYALIRSSRKTIAIEIKQDGSALIRAPYRAPRGVIETFVASKKSWMEKTAENMARRSENRIRLSARENGRLLYLGRLFPVKTRNRKNAALENGAFYVPSLSCADADTEIKRLFKELARGVIAERVAYYSGLTGIRCRQIKIGSAAKRWGSCSADNRLNFSYRLVCAPEEAIDYVVVHELSHIVEHNHSRSFWNVVSGILPDWKRRRQMLADLETVYDLNGIGTE